MTARRRAFFILDDDPDFCDDLGEALAAAGHGVHWAGDVHQVSNDHLEATDVMLLDLALPTIDGIGILSLLARLPRAPQLILISGSGEELLRTAATIGRAHGLQVLGTLRKPFAPEDVLELAEHPLRDEPTLSRSPACPSERLLPALADAISGGTLPVLYQPLLTANDLRFAGAEALLGNMVPGFGKVTPPMALAAAAGRPKLLVELSFHVLREAVSACAHWNRIGHPGKVSVNLMLEVLQDDNSVPSILKIVARGGLTPNQVVFELTEDALYHSSPVALAAMARLRLAGFGLALDDVGQRQSGLLQLANLPVTEIKIDLELVHEARQSHKARSIFGTVADLGRRLGVKVVAEGVESLDDLALARRHGVDYIQGHLVSRKRPLSELLAMQTMLGSSLEPWVEPRHDVA